MALALLTGFLTLAGCARGGPGVGDADGGRIADSGPRPDGGAPVDAAVDASTGGGCLEGQHMCNTGCTDDLPNEPAEGCRNGCGLPCPTPPTGSPMCTATGVCEFTCVPPAQQDGAFCTCAAMTCADMALQCGSADDGCGNTLNCGDCGGGTCTDGMCEGCGADSEESNETAGTASPLASIPNADWAERYQEFSLDSGDDVDWFRWSVSDSGFSSPEPTISVTLSGIPSDANFDLSVFYVCADHPDDSTCTVGSNDNELGHGCTSNAAGSADERVTLAVECTSSTSTDDSGTLYVRVRSSAFGGMCANYDLTLNVTN